MDDIRALAKHLRLLSGPAFSQATADTLNRIANAANGEQGRNLRRDFTLRNKFTAGSLMMFKASPKPDADKINALVGSKSPYLDEQEAGGVARVASHGGWKPMKAMPSKLSRRDNWVNPMMRASKLQGKAFVLKPKVNPRKPGKLTSRFRGKWSNSTSVHKAKKNFVRLKQEGVFIRQRGKVIKVRTVLHGTVTLKPTHWHSRAMEKAGRPALMSAAYGVELNRQLTKLGAK